LKRVYNSAPIA